MNLPSELFFKIFSYLFNGKFSSIRSFTLLNINSYVSIYCYLFNYTITYYIKNDELLNKLSNFITNTKLKWIKDRKNIIIGKNGKITDKGLKHVANLVRLKKIHTLNLSGCIEITDKGLEYLKGIHTLNLDGCKKNYR